MPDHRDGDRRGVAQRAEDHPVPPVLARRALRGDPYAASGGNDRQPVVNVPRVPCSGSRVWWPQIRGGRPGATVDEQGSLRDVAEPDGPPPCPRVIGGDREVAPLVPDDGIGIPARVDGRAHDRHVAQSLGESAGGRVGADELYVHVRVRGGPAALELAGVPPHRRPGVPDAQLGVPAGSLGDQVVSRCKQLPCLGQDARPSRRRAYLAAGPVQQPDPKDAFQGQDVPGHRRLRDAELDGGVGERPGVGDRHQAPEVPQFQVLHDSAHSINDQNA
jgi:hypothetical protein